MGNWRYRKKINICPGVDLNINKNSVSVTAGVKGAKITTGSKGTFATVGLPGTGISYTEHFSNGKDDSNKMKQCPNCFHKMRKQWDRCPKCNYPLNPTFSNIPIVSV